MPELRPKSNKGIEYLRAINKDREEDPIYAYGKLKEIFAEHPEMEDNFIGSGSECIILKDSKTGKKTRAVAFTYMPHREMSPKVAKMTFYLQRMFAVLTIPS